jgi:predicted nucleic acid-binding protein
MAQHRLALLGRAAYQVLADYADAIELVTLFEVPPVIAADPDDDYVIATAVAATADLIVSGDRHLLASASHGGIAIVTPAEAIALIGAA